MAKARKKTAKTKARQSAATPRGTSKQVSLAAKTAKAVKTAIAKATKAGRGRNDDMDVHVHVGDVVMMGFDGAVDAEEWGMRETNNEIAGKSRGGRGRGRDADAQDEKGRNVQRTIRYKKGSLKLEAVERSQPARKKAAKKKPAAKRTGRKAKRR